MIGFCEDCGAKNHLSEDAVSDGVVRFRCSACAYPNAYAHSEDPETPQKLSGIIQTCPEIIAAFLLEGDNPPVVIRLPGSLKPSDMAQLGLHLANSLIAVTPLFPGIREQRVCIADKHLSVLRVGKTGFFCMITKVPDLPDSVMSPIQTLLEGGHA